jgi:hypothetical protein
MRLFLILSEGCSCAIPNLIYLLSNSVVCWRNEFQFISMLLPVQYAVLVILITADMLRDLLIV